jgi:hypothetical protein
MGDKLYKKPEKKPIVVDVDINKLRNKIETNLDLKLRL